MLRMILSVSFLFLVNISIAREIHSYNEQIIDHDAIQRIYPSTIRIERGKIFLRPEMLHFHQGKMYIEDTYGSRIAIPIVFSPKEPLPYMQSGDIPILNIWVCECGAWNHKWDNPTHCWHCGLPR